MFCPKCGTQLADGSKFCGTCGTHVARDTAPAQQPVSPGANAQQTGAQQAPVTPAYVQPQPQQRPPVVPISTDRSLVMYIVLSIVTCGIYGYWFVYSIARDMNIMCRNDGDKTGGLAAYIILSFVTCGLYNLWWLYKIGNRLSANAPRYGLHFQENGTTVLLWYIVGVLLCCLGPFVAMHIIIKNTNALAAAYNTQGLR